MRIATKQDTTAITDIYQQATRHANMVGHIDWPDPFPTALATELVGTNELFCFEDGNQIGGVAKVSTEPDTRVWGHTSASALYLSKVATSNAVRGSRFFERQMLPALTEAFPLVSKVRLDCLGDNDRLIAFYEQVGFSVIGELSFFSVKSKRVLTVTRLEMPLLLVSWVPLGS